LKRLLKAWGLGVGMALLWPWVGCERLARRWAGEDVWFEPQAEWLSLIPGRLGVLARAAFYHLSLDGCPLDVGIQHGAIITQSDARLGAGVYIGIRSIVGHAAIGEGTLVADHVQILSGARHHQPLPGSSRGVHPAAVSRTQRITIGRHCWIGAQAVVMASVGDATVVGAGSIVTRPLPAAVTAYGNPARVRSQTGVGM
jgi:acetyltransferase-like isoleucine patch superfamily enzyme